MIRLLRRLPFFSQDPIGRLENLDDSLVLHGWVKPSKEMKQVPIDIYNGKVLLATVEASPPREANSDSGRFVFTFPLTADVFHQRKLALKAKVRGTQSFLPRSKACASKYRPIRGSGYRGVLEPLKKNETERMGAFG